MSGIPGSAALKTKRQTMGTVEAALGGVNGQEIFRKFGYLGVLEASPFVIASLGGQLKPWMPLAAIEIEVVSVDANDTALGTGAREVTVIGLGANYALQTVTVALNGTSPVTTGTTWLRVWRMFVSKTGTYRGSNVGTLTASDTESSPNIIIDIPADHGQTLTTHYTVPFGKTFLLYDFIIAPEATKTCHIEFHIAGDANVVTAPFTGAQRTLFNYDGISEAFAGQFTYPFKVPAMTDMWATGSIAAGNASCFFEYTGLLIDD